MDGAFIVARDIFQNPIWQNLTEFRLFLLIVGKANHSDKPFVYGDVKVGQGQWLRSYRNLQYDLEWVDNNAAKRPGKATIQRAINRLGRDGRVVCETTTLGTLFTVCNYQKYQDLNTYRKGTRDDAGDSSGTAAGQQRDNNNNCNNYKNKDIYTSDFENWYSAWPRPEAKRDSFKNFEKIRKSKGIEFIWQCTNNYLSYRRSIPETKRGPDYSSRNFFGQRAYYEDFIQPKLYIVKNQEGDRTLNGHLF